MHVLYSIQRLQQYIGRHWQCSGVGMLGFPQGGWGPVVLTKVYLGVLVQIKGYFLVEIRWKAIYWQCWHVGDFHKLAEAREAVIVPRRGSHEARLGLIHQPANPEERTRRYFLKCI